MGLFHHESDEAKAHDEAVGHHSVNLTHAAIAAAASFAAAKAYEDHQAKNGKMDDHAKAKEFLAASAAGFIEAIVEKKGLEAIDKAKAKRDAQKSVEAALAASGQFSNN